jgi:DNA-binding NarL/FixJ family response regulator
LPATIKIGVVADYNLFRAGIISLLSDYSGMQGVLEASNGKELFIQLKRRTPHLVLLDIEMPEMNGIEAMLLLKK